MQKRIWRKTAHGNGGDRENDRRDEADMSKTNLQAAPPLGTPLECALLWSKSKNCPIAESIWVKDRGAELTGDGDVVAVADAEAAYRPLKPEPPTIKAQPRRLPC